MLFGAHVKEALAVFAGLLVICLAVAGAMNNQGTPFFLLAVGGAATHFTIQLRNLDVDHPKSCLDAVRFPRSLVSGGCTDCRIVRVQWVHLR
jgi:4-hydroxybenzoate polyprenyltransferase